MVVDGNEDSYAYDKLYQLTDVDYYGGSGLSVGYDKLGNRTSTVNGETIPYVSNSLNQYTYIDSEAYYYYDDNGNMTTDRDHAYWYDCENRLTQAAGSGLYVVYKYDYQGRLVKRSQSINISKYVYDGEQIIAEYDDIGNLVRKFVYGTGIDEPVIMINVSGETETKYYYHYNGLGSVVALSDSSKNIVEKYTYDVFGTTTIRTAQGWVRNTSNYGNIYMFTGRQYDVKVSIYYCRARFYSPALGRFLQPDPIDYEDGLNLYTYCGNNPVMYIDPYGLFKFHHAVAAGFGGGIYIGAGGAADFVSYPSGAPAPWGSAMDGIGMFFSPFEDNFRDLSKDANQRMKEQWKKAKEPKKPKPKKPKPDHLPKKGCMGDFPPIKPLGGGEYA